MLETERQPLTKPFAELIQQINRQRYRRPVDEGEGLVPAIPQIKIRALFQQVPPRMGSVSAS